MTDELEINIDHRAILAVFGPLFLATGIWIVYDIGRAFVALGSAWTLLLTAERIYGGADA